MIFVTAKSFPEFPLAVEIAHLPVSSVLPKV